MGLFNRSSNKKDAVPSPSPVPPADERYTLISRYSEYIVAFMSMQQQGNYAPIAAYELPNGETRGYLYLIGDNGSYNLSTTEVLDRMEEKLKNRLADNEIISYTIFYHSKYEHTNNEHNVALENDELKAISIYYNFAGGTKGLIGLPYLFGEQDISYQGFNVFSQEENNAIFNTVMNPGKDYFPDREDIPVPSFQNEIGLTITKANTFDLANTWCGLFGFESYRKPGGSNILKEHYQLALEKNPPTGTGLEISRLEYKDVDIKVILLNNAAITIIPVIKTGYTVDVENKTIAEWENVENLEAIISGRGRETFGLWYFATDYAENRDRYLTQKKLDIKISGIVFVLDIYTKDEGESEVKYSDDFTAYIPNKDLPNYACFDFIGQLEDFRETSLLEDDSLKAYILKVRLITQHDSPEFFTIDMYVTRENMRFQGLTKGMKLTGMFQMLGEIAD